MPSDTSLIYAFVGGSLVCLHAATGQEVWRSKVPNGTSTIASVLVREGVVFLGIKGVIHCFDAYTGAIRWTNELKGLGYGTVFFGESGDTQAAAVQASQDSSG